MKEQSFSRLWRLNRKVLTFGNNLGNLQFADLCAVLGYRSNIILGWLCSMRSKPLVPSCNRPTLINDTLAHFISLESTRLLPYNTAKYISSNAIKLRKPIPYLVSYRLFKGLLESNELCRPVSM